MPKNEATRSYLLRNDGVVSALQSDALDSSNFPPAFESRAETVPEELAALRAHQRAHDALLRDLTYQLSQTNVTVFRQRVAANFTSLKDGFLALQNERKRESADYKEYQKAQEAKIRDIQRDFVEMLTHLRGLEQQVSGVSRALQGKLYRQDRSIFVLREVVKRSGIYNHYLLHQTANQAAYAGGAGSATFGPVGPKPSSPSPVPSVPPAPALRLLREVETRINGRVERLEQQIQGASQELNGDILGKLGDFTAQINGLERRFLAQEEAQEGGIKQLRGELTSNLTALIAGEERAKTALGARILALQAENAGISAEFTKQRQQIEASSAEARQCRLEVTGASGELQDAWMHLLDLQEKVDQYIQQSRIQSFYVRVDDIAAAQERMTDQISQLQGAAEQLAVGHKDALEALQNAEQRFAQAQFDTQQAAAKQARQLSESRLILQKFQEQTSVQAVNELIQQKVKVDTAQFSAAVQQLGQRQLELESQMEQLKSTVAVYQSQICTDEQAVAEGAKKALLQEYGALPMDDLSDISLAPVSNGVEAHQRASSDASRISGPRNRAPKAPKTQLIISVAKQLNALEANFGEFSKSSRVSAEKAQKSLEKHGDKITRLDRQVQDAAGLSKVQDARVKQVEEQLQEQSQFSVQAQQGLKTVSGQLAEIRAKFSVIERSQRDAVRAVDTINANYQEFCQKQTAKQQDNQEMALQQLVDVQTRIAALEAGTKSMRKQLQTAVEDAAALSGNKSLLGDEIVKAAQKCDQLASELSEARNDLTSVSACVSGLRLEFTEFAGTVQNCVQQQQLQDARSDQMQQHIANLQSVCIEQQKQIGGLKSALEAQMAEIVSLKSQKQAEDRMNVTRAVLDNVTQQNGASLSDLREMLNEARLKHFGPAK